MIANSPSICAIVLTYNESLHIKRCLDNLLPLVDHCVVVDSYSDDKTPELVISPKISFYQHSFVNYSSQFNYALSKVDPIYDWILRIDADEFFDSPSPNYLHNTLSKLPVDFNAVSVTRFINFHGHRLCFGGVSTQVVRLFRNGFGKCEHRWMDEHIQYSGSVHHSDLVLIDFSLKPLGWWIDKHNWYASREAVDLLLLARRDIHSRLPFSLALIKSKPMLKRYIKESIYAVLPTSLRSFLYFLYRYFLLLGFLDGARGFAFHFFQGWWYRFLVDCKFEEVLRFQKASNLDLEKSIRFILGIEISSYDD